jgi:hypothetical protein
MQCIVERPIILFPVAGHCPVKQINAVTQESQRDAEERCLPDSQGDNGHDDENDDDESCEHWILSKWDKVTSDLLSPVLVGIIKLRAYC